ncbi:Type 1 glutamine amidotransferase-like domain-containing protein [Candidatus Woesearchaeota archaeon]|nr:Type 1 glutamine amidotransferase-like domain-containing protein [Candidatus Woesearchaeota archaeon]
MKLLLTSGGLTNKSLRNALRDLVRPEKENRIAFIPTAANVEDSSKEWLINDLVNCQQLGIVDIVDISALKKQLWLPRLKKANILVFGGGNTFHLMYWIKKSGLEKWLPELLKTRVYVGISAGSIVANPVLSVSSSKILYYEDLKLMKDMKGLGYVDFLIRPHLNSEHFPKIRVEILKEQMKTLSKPLYAIDDNTAIKIVNNKVEIISEGKWELLQPKN